LGGLGAVLERHAKTIQKSMPKMTDLGSPKPPKMIPKATKNRSKKRCEKRSKKMTSPEPQKTSKIGARTCTHAHITKSHFDTISAPKTSPKSTPKRPKNEQKKQQKKERKKERKKSEKGGQ